MSDSRASVSRYVMNVLDEQVQEDFLSTKAKVALGVTLLVGACTGIFIKKFKLFYLATHPIQKESTRHGGELVADVLKSHGVKFLFTLSGGHISPILVAAEKLGIRVVDTRHEVNTVFAADAVARLTGTVGVAAVTAGPGMTNTITAVKNAQMAESPVLLMAGAAASLLKGRGALQDIDQLSVMKSLCKMTATVTAVRDIVPTLRKAIQTAQSGTPGPVFVEFPIDVLYPYNLVSKELGIGAKGSGKGIVQRVANWYLGNYLKNLYAGAWERRDTMPLPVNIPIAKPEIVSRCASLVRNAKKPVILVGSQTTLPPVPAEDTRRALEAMGIPCFLGGMARGLLGKKSPLQMRQKRREALQEADLIILSGAVCDFRLSYGRVLSRKAKIIAVNRCKQSLRKNSDMFWKPTVAVESDAGSFIKALSSSLTGYRCNQEWISTLRARDEEKEKQNHEMAIKPTETHLNPLKVLETLESVLPDNAILVADGGDFVGSAAYILRPRGPLTWLDPGAFGTLGVGGGFAMGAKLARPDCEVWLIWGDGASGFSIAEFDSFARQDIPVIAVIGNDACWTQIAREQVPMFGSAVACNLEFCEYNKVAEGFGGAGLIMKREDDGNIAEIFQKAREINKGGKSVLVNVMIGKSKFREGSISV